MNKYPVLFITLKDVEDLNFEQAYGQLVNTISDLCIEHDYLRNSDKEHGNGRPDVFVKDYKNRRVIIIEAKISEKRDQMENDCLTAVDQIRTRQYAQDFFQGFKSIVCYGAAFFKKECLIKRIEL